MLVQAFFKELLRQDACLREAIHPFLDFDCDVFVGVGKVMQFVDSCKLFGKVS
jgi:hypothetical protein